MRVTSYNLASLNGRCFSPRSSSQPFTRLRQKAPLGKAKMNGDGRPPGRGLAGAEASPKSTTRTKAGYGLSLKVLGLMIVLLLEICAIQIFYIDQIQTQLHAVSMKLNDISQIKKSLVETPPTSFPNPSSPSQEDQQEELFSENLFI